MSKKSGNLGCVIVSVALVGGVGAFVYMVLSTSGPTTPAEPEPVVTAPVSTDDGDAYNEIMRAGSSLDAAPTPAAATPSAGSSSTSSRASQPSHASGSKDKAQRTPSFSGWYEDADGYEDAMAAHGDGDDALVVFFYVDWCGYCKRLNGELLAESEVQRALSGMTRVRINPDHGADEKAIAQQWGVSGYPSFFVVPPGGTRGQRVHPFKTVDGKSATMTPESFVASINAVSEGR